MQAAVWLAQLLHREVELGPGAVPEQRAGGVRVGGQVALDHAELDRERDEPLLRAVVEVALQAPALVDPRLEDPPARGALLAPSSALSSPRATSSAESPSRRSASAPRVSGASEATRTSPQVRPPATTGAATAVP